VLRGSADQLDALRRQDRFIEITMQAAHQCESFGVVNAHLEGQLQARMAQWAQIISQ
jgi:endonuclease/exonuclease/phosphatase family metal-dependent hydrolase